VSVVPDVRGIDRVFDYSLPDLPGPPVTVGTSVRVPLQGRRVAGWVVADAVEPPAGVRLLPVRAVRGIGPAPDVVDLAGWAAWRWAGPLVPFLGTASPPRLVSTLPPPGRPPAVPESAPPSGPVAEALAAERSVIRLPPAAARSEVVRAVAGCLRPGGSVLVVCPSTGDAERVAALLGRDRIPVARLPEQWAEAAAGGRVVVGARAAAWGPAPGLAAALVLDGHDQAHTEERAPTWNAWQVVAERCARAGARCVVTSAVPTLELLQWGRLVVYPRAEERAGWPPVEVVDLRTRDPRSGLLTEDLARFLHRIGPEPGRPAVCVLNRRGRARLLACTACGELVRCHVCEAAMVLPRGAEALSCPACSATRPPLCTACASTRLALIRPGVTRLAEEVAALTGMPAAEISSDRSEGAEEAAIVVGTEAALHRVGRAAGIAFLELDQELTSPRYRAGEAALALLARAARLLGGRSRPLLLQTRLPDHEVVTAVVGADPGRWAAVEEPRRQALSLPPYSALALLSGPDAPAVSAGLAAAGLDAAPAGARDDWLVRAPDHRVLGDALARVRAGGADVRVEVDPVRA
jgi:primosomal protein N' (replication factor Y) (superfamily II helicase)